jgi:hypothetical protein
MPVMALNQELSKFNGTTLRVGDKVSIPMPVAPKLIPDIGSLSSFASVISNQIVIAPEEERQAGEYKISFL